MGSSSIRMALFLFVAMTTAVTAEESRHHHRRANHKRRTSTTTSTTEVAVLEDVNPLQDQPGSPETCEVARLKCAYRVGCGMALQNYMMGCSDVITGSSQKCSDHCRNSLIALTSTEEGEALMKCKCSDEFCEKSKQRIDICRSAVLRATHNSTTVSCSVAQWICMADPLCSTALDYYHRFCRSMFTGKKCTVRCKNSISILRRQEKAAKLSTCVCDGTEDYDCPSILNNMDRLCFHKILPSSTTTSTISPRLEGGGQGVEGRLPDHYGGRVPVTEKIPTISGRHPGQHHHPHPRPHDDVIESNEVETTRRPKSGATTSSPHLIVLFSAALLSSAFLR